MYVCLCRGISEAQLHDFVMQHCGSPEAIRHAMELDESCCGKCDAQIDGLIDHIICMAVHLKPSER